MGTSNSNCLESHFGTPSGCVPACLRACVPAWAADRTQPECATFQGDSSLSANQRMELPRNARGSCPTFSPTLEGGISLVGRRWGCSPEPLAALPLSRCSCRSPAAGRPTPTLPYRHTIHTCILSPTDLTDPTSSICRCCCSVLPNQVLPVGPSLKETYSLRHYSPIRPP